MLGILPGAVYWGGPQRVTIGIFKSNQKLRNNFQKRAKWLRAGEALFLCIRRSWVVAKPLLLKVTKETETWVGSPTELKKLFHKLYNLHILQIYFTHIFSVFFVKFSNQGTRLHPWSRSSHFSFSKEDGQAEYLRAVRRSPHGSGHPWECRPVSELPIFPLWINPTFSNAKNFLKILSDFHCHSASSFFKYEHHSSIKLSQNHADSTVEKLASFWFRGAAFERIIRATCSSNVVSPFPLQL